MIRSNHELLKLIDSLYSNGKYVNDSIQFKKIKKNRRIIIQDKSVSHVYIIKQGILKCYLTEGKAKNFILEFLGKGEIAGGIAVLQQSNAVCNVEAITDIYAYKIEVSFYVSLVNTNKEFNKLLMQALASRLQAVGKRTASQQLNMLKYSVQKVQAIFKEQEITINKADLADYLGISKRSLNRVLKGLIKYDGNENALKKRIA